MKKLSLASLCTMPVGVFWVNPSASPECDAEKGAVVGAVESGIAGEAIGQTTPDALAEAAAGGPSPPSAGPPVYTFAAPPEVASVPGTYAYFVPGISADIFFYGGRWYRSFRGSWFNAFSYNGPWVYVPGPGLPRVFLSLPPGWHRVRPGYRPIPHEELLMNWQRWERQGHREGHK